MNDAHASVGGLSSGNNAWADQQGLSYSHTRHALRAVLATHAFAQEPSSRIARSRRLRPSASRRCDLDVDGANNDTRHRARSSSDRKIAFRRTCSRSTPLLGCPARGARPPQRMQWSPGSSRPCEFRRRCPDTARDPHSVERAVTAWLCVSTCRKGWTRSPQLSCGRRPHTPGEPPSTPRAADQGRRRRTRDRASARRSPAREEREVPRELTAMSASLRKQPAAVTRCHGSGKRLSCITRLFKWTSRKRAAGGPALLV